MEPPGQGSRRTEDHYLDPRDLPASLSHRLDTMLYPNAPLCKVGCTLAGLQSGARRKTACADYPIQDSLGDGIVDDVYEHPAGDAEGPRLEIHGYSSSRCAQASDRG